MVRLNELSIGESGSVPENIVVSFHVEDILKLPSVFVLNTLLNNECHETEWQRQVLLEYEPVVVLTI